MSAGPGIAERKRDLRLHLRARRRAREAGLAAASDRAIALAAARAARIAQARTLAGYVASDGEPDVAAILDAARARAARVLLPRQRPDGSLELVETPSGAALTAARGGILEPAGPAIDPALLPSPAVLLAPAVALDPAGRRLGRGGGAYDRLLPVLRALGWTVVGVCRADDLLAALPEEPHDQRVDAVLSDLGFRGVTPPR